MQTVRCRALQRLTIVSTKRVTPNIVFFSKRITIYGKGRLLPSMKQNMSTHDTFPIRDTLGEDGEQKVRRDFNMLVFDHEHYGHFETLPDEEVLEEYKDLCADVIGKKKEFDDHVEHKRETDPNASYTYIGPDQQTMLRIAGLIDIMRNRGLNFETPKEVEHWLSDDT